MNSQPFQSNEVFDLPRLPRGAMVLQWHITERCNLKCVHCYQDGSCRNELTFDQLCRIIDQFKRLLEKRQLDHPEVKIRGLINITGGEPFVRKDFFDLLERFAGNRDFFSFGILSNGTLIDADIARRLSVLKPSYIQVSLEGSKDTNDAIRGNGSFDRILAGLKHVISQGIRTLLSFTAYRGNFHEFSNVAAIACDLGVDRVWADRLIPFGSGASLEEQLLTPSETREFFEIMYNAYCESQKRFCNTEVYMGRALQFLVGGGEPYRCAAGNRLLTLQANGDVYPCRRMPILVGNVLETDLVELFENSGILQRLRNHVISDGCESCTFNRKCRGGLKCLSYAVYGDPFIADPGCWRAAERPVPE